MAAAGRQESGERPTLLLSRAARALVAGRYAQAVGLLRVLETRAEGVPPEFRPAYAAARGHLAARAGDWEQSVTWYREALEADTAALLLPIPPTGVSCRVGGCAGRVRLRCGQCHRPCCAEHGVIRRDGLVGADGPGRCDDCLWTGLGNLARAAVVLGGSAAAEQVIDRWARLADCEEARLLSDVLRGLVVDPDELPEEGLGVFRAMLLRRIAAEVEHGDAQAWADDDLVRRRPQRPSPATRVFALVDGVDGFADVLAEMRLRAARAAADAGRPFVAASLWEAAWAVTPDDAVLAHAVGLASLARAPHERNTHLARESAGKAVGCLCAALAGDAYWDALARVTGRTLTATERDQARSAFAEEILTRLRALDALIRPPAYQRLELAWEVEQSAVRRLTALAAGTETAGRREPGHALLGGPEFLDAMLDLLHPGPLPGGWHEAAPRLLVRWSTPNVDRVRARLHRSAEFQAVVELYDRYGPHVHLLRERRFNDAVESVESHAVASPVALAAGDHRQELHRLLAAALVGRAGQRLEARDWQGAFEDFEQAAACGARLAKHRTGVEQAARQWGLLRHRADRSSWKSYVSVLQRAARLLPDSPELVADLAAALARVPSGAVLPTPVPPPVPGDPDWRPRTAPAADGDAEEDPEAGPPAEPASPYRVLGVDLGADGSAVQAAYVRGLKAAGRDPERKRRLSAARSVLANAERRCLADLFEPLAGHAALTGPGERGLVLRARELVDQHVGALHALVPGLAELLPQAPTSTPTSRVEEPEHR
ncbi:hypothetical protein [Streptacidiphilus jiangxiensis]|uniref:Tetratricopeptide repeat-containing protein n=1 Tax=Streptacidiphilus jiangxiensis TaxID=235985 RepID=A0A1H7RDE7_STRJI|nr:hypothetical protein [Streptacidiphilus jiangxiensis]SEL57944.1 hypothetical protein SAMN05414137_11054 [Streptacidiphilus jiangxiensis]